MIPKYSVKRPYTVLVAVVLVIVLGVVSLTRMTTDLLPAMNLPYVIVVTTDVGASPEEVEKDVTAPIEAAMATTSNINNVSSSSYDNYSMVVLEYEQSTNMDSAMIEIQQQLDQLTGQFPDTAGSPIIMQIDPDMMPVMIASADVDGMDQAEVSNYVDNELLPLLESIEGVASVTATGVLDTDLQVTMNQEKIDALNEQILSKIDLQFTDAQAELDKASSQINSGKKKLEDGQSQLGSQLGAGENEIINNKIQLFNTEADLTTQLSDLQKSQSSMDCAIKSLQSTYEGATQLQSAIDGLQKAKDGVAQAKSGAKQLYQAHDGVVAILSAKNPVTGADMSVDEALGAAVQYGQMTQEQANQLKTVITTLQADPAMLEAYKKATSESDFVSYMESAAIAQINAQADTKYTSESDIASQIVTLQSKLDDINVMLMSQASSFADAGVTLTSYKDIPAAIAKLSESKTQIATGIATIESAQTQVADGKTSLDDALVTLNESQVSGIMEMSKGYADLAVAANKIEEGQSQLDDAKEQAKDSANLNTILTMDTLKNLLTAQNFSMPAGYVTEGNEQYLVRVGDEMTSKADLENLVLMDLGMDGIEPIRLSDVADIEYIDNSGDSYSKVNGNPAVMLSIEKQTGYSTGDVTDRLLEKFDSLESENAQLHLSVLMNQGIYIDMIVKSVVENMIVGAILAIIVLLLFLKDIKPTLVIACSIPLSVVFAVVLMYFTHITLNIISLSGLALGIGMLVDNSIVVIENIYRLRSKGVGAARAAVQGTKQVAGAIIASTLTTVCVFLPMVFTAGTVRELMMPISLTIIFTLAASLLIAMTVVPAAGSTLLRNSKEKKHPFFDKVQDIYGKMLAFCLKVKVVPLAIAIGLLVYSIWAVMRMGIVMIPDMTSNQIEISVQMPEDTDKEECYKRADQVLDAMTTVDGIGDVGAMAGGDTTLVASSSGMSDSTYDQFTFLVLTENENAGKEEVNRICREIEERTADIDCELTISTGMSEMSTMMGSGLSVKVYGDDLDTLTKITQDICDLAATIPGYENISNGQEEPDQVIRLVLDKDAAMRKGLTVAQIFSELNGKMTESTDAATVTIDGEDMKIVVKDGREPLTRENLLDYNFEIQTTDDNGNTVTEDHPLSEFATLKLEEGVQSINRENQSRYMTVTATVAEGSNATLLSRELQPLIDAYELPDGYTIDTAGESDMVNQMVIQMSKVLLLGLALIYLVMVAQFQSLLSPFIVLFTVPLAFTGGLIGLLLMNEPLSVMGMMGFVVLLGTVVNNGIVFVDYANQLRMGGLERREALIATGKTRMRPILMTALTTILAMVSLLFGDDLSSQMSKGMAIVVAGGLAYATLMTLFIIPVMYDILFKRKPLQVDIGSENLDDVPDDAADYLKRKEQKELEQQEATQQDEKNPK